MLSVTAVHHSFLTMSLAKYRRSTGRLTAIPQHPSHLHRGPAATRLGLSAVLHVGHIRLFILSHEFDRYSAGKSGYGWLHDLDEHSYLVQAFLTLGLRMKTTSRIG
jgi:hypothetical protein